MIAIIILLTFILSLLLQDRFFKNKKNYKNKYIKVYQNIKIPLFISFVVALIYDLINQENPEIEPSLFMTQPCF